MTIRGRLLVLFGILGLWLAVLRNQDALAVVSLALLAWICLQWIVFELRLCFRWPELIVTRKLNGRPCDTVTTLWAERPLKVELEVQALAGPVAHLVTLGDCLPDNLVVDAGRTTLVSLDCATVFQFQYDGHCPAAGKTSFFGLRFQLRDAYGLFLAERVVRDPREYRVLSGFVQSADMRPTIKRMNSLPQHGIHQLRRAGLGSELLELREYQPGDPPKSIAWKVTARRGKLMTRQYESEVPVRVSLFLDAGGELCSGSLGKRPLDRLSSLAASIAKAAVAVGDAVGIVVLDEAVRQRVRPAHGDRAFYRTLEALAEFAHAKTQLAETLSPAAWKFAAALSRERYPDLMNPKVFQPSFRIFPLWPSARRRLAERRQLAFVMSELNGLQPTELIELVYDERKLARAVSAWLVRSGRGSDFLADGNSREAVKASRFDLLAHELTRAVAYANDNELFVVMADLLSADQQIENLLSATKVALARHHRVVFICPSTVDWLSSASLETVDAVFARVAQLDVSAKAQNLRRRLRAIGARLVFADERSIVSAVMADAELAGSGRSPARSATR